MDARSGGWLGVGERTYKRFLKHRGSVSAAAIAYYSLFSIFPLTLALISLGSLVLDSEEAQEAALSLVAQFTPAAVDLVEETIQQVLQGRGTFGIIAVLGFLWSATGVFGALNRAINTAWEAERPRPVWAERAILLFLSVISTAIFEVALRLYDSIAPEVPESPGLVPRLATLIIPYLFTALLFWVVYRVLPYAQVAWSDVLPGALLASLVWEVAKDAFTFYATEFALYSLVYGSLAAVIILLLWSYLSATIILLGAEFTVQYARRRRSK
jgi:membrane protein